MISFDEAYQLTRQAIQPLPPETIQLIDAEGRVTAQDLRARVDSPSLNVSLKDGYAVLAQDIQSASPTSPIRLELVGSSAAGSGWQGMLQPGQAVRILSGAPLPNGADAIVSEEFTQTQAGFVMVMNTAEPWRNVLPQGADVHCGEWILPAGQQLHPTMIGLLAAAGYAEVPVIQRPRVAVLATGDEVLAPGQPLVQGKLYASNCYTLAAWCQHYGFYVETHVLHDEENSIRQAITSCLQQFDAILTSGGAWKGERDLVIQMLDSLGWQKIYHRVRIGPGKAVGFGIFESKPVFCLPGGPPSNHMAFLQLALPGLHTLAGISQPGLKLLPAMMAETIYGQPDWTQFVHGRLSQQAQNLVFHPLKQRSRLQEMAQTQAIVQIAEGQSELSANRAVMVQVLDQP